MNIYTCWIRFCIHIYANTPASAELAFLEGSGDVDVSVGMLLTLLEERDLKNESDPSISI